MLNLHLVEVRPQVAFGQIVHLLEQFFQKRLEALNPLFQVAEPPLLA